MRQPNTGFAVGLAAFAAFALLPSNAHARTVLVQTEADLVAAEAAGLGAGDIVKFTAASTTLTHRHSFAGGVTVQGTNKEATTVLCDDAQFGANNFSCLEFSGGSDATPNRLKLLTLKWTPTSASRHLVGVLSGTNLKVSNARLMKGEHGIVGSHSAGGTILDVEETNFMNLRGSGIWTENLQGTNDEQTRIVVKRSTFRNVDGNGIFSTGSAKISGSTFEHCGSAGVRLIRLAIARITAGTPNSFVRGSTFSGATATGINVSGQEVNFVELSGNTMTLNDAAHRVGVNLASMSQAGATEVDIRNNTITAYEGILADDVLGGSQSTACFPGSATYATSCGLRITGNTLTAAFQTAAPPAQFGTIFPRGISAYGLHWTGYAVISENRVSGFNEGIVLGHRTTGSYVLTPSLFNNLLTDNAVGVYVMKANNPANLTRVNSPAFYSVLVTIVNNTFVNNTTGVRVQPEAYDGSGALVTVDVHNNIFTTDTTRPEAVTARTSGDNNLFFGYQTPMPLSVPPFSMARGNVFSNPQLVSTVNDPRRYALPSGSALCAGGRAKSSAPTTLFTPTDILGATRRTPAPSLGAFECP